MRSSTSRTCSGSTPQSNKRVDADEVEAHVLVGDATALAQLVAHHLGRLLRLGIAAGAAVDDAAHAHVAFPHGERDARVRRARMAGGAVDAHRDPVRPG